MDAFNLSPTMAFSAVLFLAVQNVQALGQDERAALQVKQPPAALEPREVEVRKFICAALETECKSMRRELVALRSITAAVRSKMEDESALEIYQTGLRKFGLKRSEVCAASVRACDPSMFGISR